MVQRCNDHLAMVLPPQPPSTAPLVGVTHTQAADRLAQFKRAIQDGSFEFHLTVIEENGSTRFQRVHLPSSHEPAEIQVDLVAFFLLVGEETHNQEATSVKMQEDVVGKLLAWTVAEWYSNTFQNDPDPGYITTEYDAGEGRFVLSRYSSG